ncbi:divalent-cation tolerance protein CutA [Botrimarina hoheduenensis]|uniref:Divalent-cation tolerance protein CutA n=1 Tax=Botrimarina hoheduenensis TaxID=2528000 RepID=A0A5C5W8Q4_9BACT|nr:divalent-cation tolerance protein CutA [Botrimarina hoheduenensis]TWT46857.1 Divalent-cation tolerance protein CutA [Botrimarina hoheduenensis]
MPTPALLLVTTTAPDRATADRLARVLVERRLAACVQVAGPLHSTYRWQGVIESAEEWQVTAKTLPACFAALSAALHELHPYETPELIATPVTEVSAAYAAWVAEECAE